MKVLMDTGKHAFGCKISESICYYQNWLKLQYLYKPILIAIIHLFLLTGLTDSDPGAIQEFSKKYVVEEDLVRKYVCHLEDLCSSRKKKRDLIKEKASKRGKKQDVRWFGLGIN